MKGMRPAVLAIALLLCAGCIRSLHPLYTEDDLIYAPGLVGTWAEENSKETWTFSPEGDRAYRLVYTDDKGNSGAFHAHLLDLKGRKFMDFLPEVPDSGKNDFYEYNRLPVHSFAFVKQVEPVLQLSLPDADWLKKLLESNPEAIAHEMLDDEPLLTASTPALQAFFVTNAEAPGAFGEPSQLRRIPAAAPERPAGIPPAASPGGR